VLEKLKNYLKLFALTTLGVWIVIVICAIEYFKKGVN
jgi:hypothetical protein